MSPTPDSTLDDPQQTIADLKRQLEEAVAERDHLRSERDEALGRETATAEVLGVINSSPGDLAPVFEAILEKAHALCGAVFGGLAVFDGEQFQVIAYNGAPDFIEYAIRPPPNGDTPLGRLTRGAEFVHVPDVHALDAYHEFSTFRFDMDRHNIRTMLVVPLQKEGALLGAISAYRQEVRPFTDKQIALLQNFAAQAVIAMENARLLTETREALEQQTATAEVLQVINSSPGDLAPVFDAMLEKAIRLCEATHGHLFTYDGESFHLSAARSNARYIEWAREAGPVRPHPTTPLGRLTRGDRIVHVADIREDEGYRAVPIFRESVELRGVRSIITVALLKDNVLLGAMNVYRQEVRPFSDKQVALLENFAAQAVIAMENARLITETREALEQQTATAEVLGVINSSPGDLAPVFDAMLVKALRLCGAAFGTLNTYDGQHFRHAANRGASAAWLEWLQKNPSGLAADGTLMRVPLSYRRLLAGEDLIHDLDLKAQEPYRDGDPNRRALVDLAGARTHLALALRKDETLLGGLTIYRKEVRPFTDKQIALLQNFAAQAVIAMENARLISETREALEQQTATAEVLGVINSSPGDLAPVFDAILEKAHALCGIWRGSLQLYDGDRFCAVATRGVSEAQDTLLRQPHPPGSGGARLLAGDRFYQLNDQAEAVTQRQAADPVSAAGVTDGVRTLLLVPLRKEASLIGMITAARMEVRPFSDKEIALLENFAAQAVIAMENARLLGELRQRTDDLAVSLEYQTAISDVLEVISQSTFDLQPVLDTLCETAARLCDANSARIALQRDGSYRYVSSFVGRAISPEWDAMVREMRLRADRGTVTGRALLERQTVHVADISASAEEYAIPETFTVGGIRTLLAVPLLREDELIGLITLSRTEVDPFMDRQIELVRTFADQAVIAIENARLLGETREALEQQTATAEVLGVINSSPGDLAPVFDAILEKAHILCGAVIGALEEWDGERIRALATRGLPAPFEALIREGYRPGPNNAHWQLVDGARFVHIPDHAAVDDPVHQKAAEVGFRTFLAVALRKDNVLLGRIVAARQEVRPFAEKEIGLLENFAAQAVIAMENARLLTETREALEQQTATAEVLQVINSSPGDLAPVFDAMLEKATRLCEATYGDLYTYDGSRYHPVAVHGEAEFVEWRRQRGAFAANSPGAPLDRLIAGEQVVAIDDAPSTEAYRASPGFRGLVDASGIRSGITVGLRKEGTLLGAITVYRQEVRPFTDKQIALLQNFAAQAVIAMENARLLGELRQRTEEVGELNRNLEARVAAQVDELGRVGRLKRFLAPQLAELIVSHGDEKILESHRREIVVVFCDLRGYTAFTETAEPEEVLDFLRQYHGALGPLVSQFEGTLDQFSGDGIMVFFNDPIPCPDPAERAVKMAIAMREVAGTLIAAWRRRGRMLGFGAGIAQGYATLGQIGFADRSGYTAIGTVCNLAARLCAEAKDGQILIAQLVAVAVEETTPLEEVGELTLKGLTQPVVAYNVPLAAIQPALRVIEGGNPQTV